MKNKAEARTIDNSLQNGERATDVFSGDIYRTIVDRMEQGVLVFNDQEILGANEQLCALLNIPTDLVTPGTLLETFIRYGVERGDYKHGTGLTLAAMRMRLAAKEDYVIERILPTGRTVRIDVRHLGEYAVGTYTDITDNLREKAILSNIIEAIAQGLLVHDEEHIVASNRRMVEVLEIPEKLARPGESWENIYNFRADRGDYKDKELQLKNIRRAIKTGKGFATESPAKSKTIHTEVRHSDGMMFVTFTDITEAKARELKLRLQEREVRKLAETDGLTGLANRRAFDQDLPARFSVFMTFEREKELALILIDLDHFKPINDTYGHTYGDTLLKELADRFRKTVRPLDLVARIGGDEFAVIAEVDTKDDALEIAERLGNAARKPVNVNETHLKVGASIGIAYRSDGFKTAEEMIIGADLALYAAKSEKRGALREYKEEFAYRAKRKYRLEQDLQHALARNELFLHYQVQKDLRSDRIIGYEALLRWMHPRHGLIPPSDFIPLAEDTGHIVEIGKWVLQTAASDFSRAKEPLRVAVNVSPIQFAKSNIVADVEDALKVSGLAPHLLEVEITEDVLIQDDDETSQTLQKLREIGVGLSLDDFGSGYSSLSYLSKYPFSKLKIDRFFIHQMDMNERSQALVMSILSLASTMGMKVTAEGIETQDQLDKLIEGKCDEAQGYFLGKPQSISEIAI